MRAEEGMAVRVATYNIFGARHPGPLATVVRALAPDVIVANETPKLPLVWRCTCDRIAASWAMRRAAGGRDAGSNMICVSDRIQVLSTRAIRLQQPLFRPRRGIVSAQCALGGVEFGVVGVHLSLLSDWRLRGAEQAIAVAAELRGPVVLGGDLNERAGGSSWSAFRDAGFEDAARPGDMTFSSTSPGKRIDALLTRGGVVEHVGTPALSAAQLRAASDHLPVVGTLLLS
ncbi:MAG: endonuclease/exonuclease/phosphatase family protein [Nocardioidaceae bacterium]